MALPYHTRQIERVPCLSDNYAWLLHEPSAGVTAVVDPAEVAPVVEALRQKGWKLTHVLNSERAAVAVPGMLCVWALVCTMWPGCKSAAGRAGTLQSPHQAGDD